MTIRTAFELRMKRARMLVEAKKVYPNGEPGQYDVQSQHGERKYHVALRIDHTEIPGFVLEAHCTCPDWRKMNEWLNEYPNNPGLSHINYSAACKHVLASCIEEGVL